LASPAPPTAPTLPLARVVANAVGFQAGWFACVVGAASGQPAWGAAIAVQLLALHTPFAPRPWAELRLMGAAVAIGMAWDSALAATGVVQYHAGVWLEGAAPYWIGVLWALFAATLNQSLRWLRRRPLLGVVVGAVGGPLSFWAGQRLGAASFPNTPLALAVLSVGWALLMPALAHLACRLDEAPDAGQPQPSHA
jgi:hypothetical protein